MGPEYKKVIIKCATDLQEVLIAELLEIGFDSFEETDVALFAYIATGVYNQDLLEEILDKYDIDLSSSYSTEMMENKNWNEEWEKYFDPVVVRDKILVRATFHTAEKEYPYEIIVNPKMSFGTGHHETTALMLESQLNINHYGKTIIDIGTGTGILAIMANKLGASHITATDIDDWSIENSKENFKLNALHDVNILKGGIEHLGLNGQYDIILANITRNILLHDLPFYSKIAKLNSHMLLSGFYNFDADEVQKMAGLLGFKLQGKKENNDWVCLHFIKTN